MNAFAVNVKSLIKPGLTFPVDGSNVKIEHVYSDGCADYLTRLWLTHDDWRGTLVICPRCNGAARGLHHAPNLRGLCCVDCLSRLKRIEDNRESRKASRKPTSPNITKVDTPTRTRATQPKISEISENKPAIVSGRQSTPAPGNKSFSKKEKKFPELPATRLHSSATNKKAPSDKVVTHKKAQPAKRRRQVKKAA